MTELLFVGAALLGFSILTRKIAPSEERAAFGFETPLGNVGGGFLDIGSVALSADEDIGVAPAPSVAAPAFPPSQPLDKPPGGNLVPEPFYTSQAPSILGAPVQAVLVGNEGGGFNLRTSEEIDYFETTLSFGEDSGFGSVPVHVQSADVLSQYFALFDPLT